jgi:hypothetical protein
VLTKEQRIERANSILHGSVDSILLSIIHRSKDRGIVMQRVINREDWLTRAAMIANEHLFRAAKYTVPNNVRYAMSLPSRNAMGKKRTTIGQCWSSKCSDDGTYEIFVTPMIDDMRDVFATLVHEIVHAVVGLEHGHDKVFKRCALAVGLEGKMTATTMTDETWDRMKPLLVAGLGEYPHAKMQVNSTVKKQTTRMIKAECLLTNYKVRVSRSQVESYGEPVCPCCLSPMTIDS